MAYKIYSSFIALLFALSLSSSALSQTNTQSKPFKHSGLDYEITLFEKFMAKYPKAEALSVQRLVSNARDALVVGNYPNAIFSFIQAISKKSDDAELWLGLADVYLTAKPGNSTERYNFPQRASVTSYRAYQIAKTDELKARALVSLAKALEKRSYWRPAIDAYKLSLVHKEDVGVRRAYLDLRAQKGFRVLNYKVDSETENPRLCVQFSETLSKARVDFSKFVTVDGKDPAGVVREDRQLCVDGFRHGQRYVVRIREGLPSKIGEKILKSADLTIYVRDRKPAVRFTGNGYVLPKTGQNGLPLVSVNTKSVDVEVYRVGDRALNQAIVGRYMQRSYTSYAISKLKNDLGAKVWSGVLEVKSELNKDVTTALPVTEAIKDLKPGLYVAYASVKGKKVNYNTPKATQWFVVSDLGLTSLSGKAGMDVFVRSLETASPIKGVKVRLIARSNEVLGSAVSDENGRVSFDKGLLKGEGSQAPQLVVAERDAGDYGFLDVTHSAFDLTDRGVKGRRNPDALDGFIYAERGVYRTGEDVYLTGLLRDPKGKAVPKIPLTLIIRRPDGVEHKRTSWPDEGAGGRSHIFTVPNGGMSGKWSASIYTDPKSSALGFTSFLVEDYTPQRLELTLSSERDAAEVNKDVKLSATGRYLYGAPASNMSVSGEILVRENSKGLKGFKGYRFGAFDERFLNVNKQLSDLPNTDKDGLLRLVSKLPDFPQTGKLLEAQFTIRLNEPGGRSLAKSLSLAVKPTKTLLGIKPLFNNNHIADGETAEFDIAAVGPDGKQTGAKGLTWELLKVENRYQWYNQNGYWNYKTITYTTKVADGKIDAKADKAVKISHALKWGTYRLEVGSDDPNGPRSSYQFYSGWYGSNKADRPDKLDLVLDKPKYKAGETLTVSLSPKSDGKALVAVVEDTVLAVKTVDVKKSGTQVSFDIDKNWGAGAYVTAVFYRPMDTKARRMPTRSIGLSWVKQDLSDKSLKIVMDVPEKIRPNKKFDVPVTIEGLKEGDEANVVIAAVDVGILNLTNYKAPKPENWYYGQRLMGTEIRDVYGKLIDGMHAAAGKIRSGGGGALAIGGNGAPLPSSVEPTALYSGIVIVGKDGKANVSFDMPAFDGTVRLMAIAWTKNKLGSAQRDVIVRDPVVVIGTAPYFLTSGDSSNLHFSLDNVEGKSGSFTYKIAGEGAVTIDGTAGEASTELKEKERKQFLVPIKAKGYGAAKIALTVSGPDGFTLKREFNLAVKPAAPNIKKLLVRDIPKDGGKLTISKDIVAGLLPGSVKVSVNVDKTLALDVPGLLLALDRYPYGCAEQTTSRALPLLYLSKFAEKTDIGGDKGVKTRIQKAIDRLIGLQSSAGGFGLWSPSSSDMWLTAYVTDFLTRAKEQGYSVPKISFDLALDQLQNQANYISDFKSGGEGLAYALYVLARNGRAGIGDLRYFADAKLNNFSTPLAQAQLGAALSMYGDKARAKQAYNAALRTLKNSLFDTRYRADFGSALRDGAATLTLISETNTGTETINSLTELLERARSSKMYTSTQENAWLLLAAHALQNESRDLQLGVNGVPHTGTLKEILKVSHLQDKDFVVTNRSKNKIQAALTITGDGENPEPAASEGFEIDREFYTLDGKLAKLDSVKQNDRFVVVLKVKEDEAKRGRLILVDRIPAGFVIENPRLVTSGDIKNLPWLKYNSRVEHTAFKDDKFVAAFNMAYSYKKGKPASMTSAYIIRAVSPGSYVHPAAVIEDMYRPDRFGRTKAGKVTITSK